MSSIENNGMPSASTRRWLIHLLLLVSAVLQVARIAGVQSSTGEVPFLSANDRSRWCTVASLAINGSYEIDDVVEIRDPETRRRVWYTIDMVRHRGTDGKQHYYSSKPPLLPSMYAGVYYVLRATTGASLMNDPFFVARVMLVLVNVLPLLAFWWLLTRWLVRDDLDIWGTVVLAVFLAFGTYLTTFANTLNNHLPAALSVGLSLWCIDRVALSGDCRWRWFVIGGLSTSFGAANELPALSWVAAAGAILLIVNPKRTLLAYVPALLPVTVAFFATNYAAHGELVPAYAHRSLGDKIAEIDLAPTTSWNEIEPQSIVSALRSKGFEVSDNSIVRAARRQGVWELWDETNEQRFGLKRASAEQASLGIYEWGDWYDYPSSYWVGDRKQGVDKGEPDRLAYAFHCLAGHHGIFSLTPFWLLSLLGCVSVWRWRKTWNLFKDHRLLIAAAILATSLVAIGFYLARPLEDRNYGGVSSGFRWAFWLTIPWFWLAVHGVQRLQAKWARRVVEGLLAVSIFSSAYPWTNPWTSPWLMQYWEYLGWL